MFLHSLRLKNFRNYLREDVHFKSRVNLFLGENGQGKTNLLEAISFLTQGRPVRYCRKDDLVMNNASTMRLEGHVEGKSSEFDLSMAIHEGKTAFKIGDKSVSGARLQELFSVVLFSPESLSVIKSGPAERRDLIDELAVENNPAVASQQKEWSKCLKTKNRLLKDASENRVSPSQMHDLLESLNSVLLPLATEVIFSRLAALKTILPLVNNAAKIILNDPSVDISVDYVISKKSSIDWGKNQVYDTLKLRLNELKDAEIRSGLSLVGPHKNDVVFKYNHQDARFFCSQGQQRAIVLAFKIAQVELCHLRNGHYPLLLLDDVLSELDSDRREKLLEILARIRAQIFLTSTDLAATKLLAPEDVSVFRIEKGSVNSQDGTRV